MQTHKKGLWASLAWFFFYFGVIPSELHRRRMRALWKAEEHKWNTFRSRQSSQCHSEEDGSWQEHRPGRGFDKKATDAKQKDRKRFRQPLVYLNTLNPVVFLLAVMPPAVSPSRVVKNNYFQGESRRPSSFISPCRLLLTSGGRSVCGTCCIFFCVLGCSCFNYSQMLSVFINQHVSFVSRIVISSD